MSDLFGGVQWCIRGLNPCGIRSSPSRHKNLKIGQRGNTEKTYVLFVEISRFARFHVRRMNCDISETAHPVTEKKNGDHFAIQKLTAETTFRHSTVVFRPLLRTKRTFSWYSLVARFLNFLWWGVIFTFFCINARSGQFIFGLHPF